MNRDFIKSKHPDFLDTYDQYPHNIQRVDAVRYFILYQFGGLFVDLDFECLKNVEPLLQDTECVFGLEPKTHGQRLNKENIVCNAFMAATKKNYFFSKICADLKQYNPVDDQKHGWQNVLESTGPFKLKKLYGLII